MNRPTGVALRGALAILIATLGLAGCFGGSGGSREKPVVTIADPMAFLTGPERRYDFGHYQVTQSVALGPDRAVTTWEYPAVPAGNGGEQYVVEGDTVRIEGTRDGGTPYDQHFVGKDCGGTGWPVFRTDASAEWREMVAHLSISADPTKCSAGSPALTRYTLRPIDFPIIGRHEAIVSEHYSTGSRDAPAMERSFFVRGVGRVAWQAFSLLPPSLPPDEMARRCPGFGWQTAGALNLVDCRISVFADGPATKPPSWQLGK